MAWAVMRPQGSWLKAIRLARRASHEIIKCARFIVCEESIGRDQRGRRRKQGRDSTLGVLSWWISFFSEIFVIAVRNGRDTHGATDEVCKGRLDTVDDRLLLAAGTFVHSQRKLRMQKCLFPIGQRWARGQLPSGTSDFSNRKLCHPPSVTNRCTRQ
jgi:hypothetical protein